MDCVRAAPNSLESSRGSHEQSMNVGMYMYLYIEEGCNLLPDEQQTNTKNEFWLLISLSQGTILVKINEQKLYKGRKKNLSINNLKRWRALCSCMSKVSTKAMCGGMMRLSTARERSQGLARKCKIK